MARFCTYVFLLIASNLFAAAAEAQATDVDCIKCVDGSDIAVEAVSTYKLKKQAVTASRLAKDAVTTNKLKNGAVTEKKLAPDVVDAIHGTRRPMVIDGNDTVIGQLISIGENGWGMEVISDKGYLITVSPSDAGIGDGTQYFASDNCSGIGYAGHSNFGGYVMNLFDGAGVKTQYYVPKDGLPIENFESGSLAFNEDGCYPQMGVSTVYPVLPNDPGLTGINTGQFVLPIRVDLVAP